ncbi:MAG TPA: TonB family protein [Bryobacteraceae bacterium]|nr:TonB family protein [Bryobacteraceae bacterium]
MPESAVRAERFDSSNTTSTPSYLWEVAGKPVSVQIGLDLVDRLEHEVVENFRSLNSRGSEIGGVLLGNVQNGSPLRVSIQSYELIPCDYSRGPLYRFSEADVERFDRAIQQRGASGQRVVGFFRSHTRKGLNLDAEDVAFFSGHFREPHQVALLIRPYASKPSSAGYFIWENGNVRGDSSYLEFAFRRSALEKGPGAETTGVSNDSSPEPAPTSVPEPAPSKPTVRAQIVPIASRREITLTQPAPERTSTEIEKPPVVEPPASEKAPSLHGSPMADKPLPTQRTPLPDRSSLPPLPTQRTAIPDKTAVSPKPVTEKSVTEKPAAEKSAAERTGIREKTAITEKPTEKNLAPDKTLIAEKTAITEKMSLPIPKPAEETAAVSKPAVEETEAKEPESSKGFAARGKLMWVAGAAAVLLLMLSGALVYPGIGHKSHRVGGVAGAGSSAGLALHVERSSGALLLTWNRDSDAVKNAIRGELAINDGDQHETVNVDLPQLRNGSIVYTPSGADIVFQLSVIGKDSSKVDSESVRVLHTRPSPMPDSNVGVNDKTATATIRPSAGVTVPVSSNPPVETADAGDAKPVAAAAPVRPFASPELPSQRLRPARPSDLPDAPHLTQTDQIAVVLPGSANLAPPPSPAPTPAPPAASAAVKIGGQIRQAEVLTRVNPEYPMSARQARVQGSVVVSATVGADGRIKAVKPLSGPPLLQTAAASAVKQWVYKPAMLNGTPIESETRIELKFTLER